MGHISARCVGCTPIPLQRLDDIWWLCRPSDHSRSALWVYRLLDNLSADESRSELQAANSQSKCGLLLLTLHHLHWTETWALSHAARVASALVAENISDRSHDVELANTSLARARPRTPEAPQRTVQRGTHANASHICRRWRRAARKICPHFDGALHLFIALSSCVLGLLW